MKIIPTSTFIKYFKKIKDKKTREKLLKIITKLTENPEIGKPLKYKFKKYRSIRIKPYRIIYSLGKEGIILNYFEHRSSAYK